MHSHSASLSHCRRATPTTQGVLGKAKRRGTKTTTQDCQRTKRKRGIRSAFVSPMRADEKQGGGTTMRRKQAKEDAVDEATMKW